MSIEVSNGSCIRSNIGSNAMYQATSRLLTLQPLEAEADFGRLPSGIKTG